MPHKPPNNAAVPSPARNGSSSGASGLSDPELYINRELSLLAFQRRVLEEAEDETNPLLERVNFLSILGSNLDEFFMVRVAGLAAQMDAGTLEVGPDRMSPRAQLVSIRREVKKLLSEAHKCREAVLEALREEGVFIYSYDQLSASHKQRAADYFANTVFPVLTPLAFDPGRPFPHISNLSLNLAVAVRDKDGVERFARVKVPHTLPQLVLVEGAGAARPAFIWLEELIQENLQMLFPGLEVIEAYPFRVTRDAEVEIQELESDDLLETIEEAVWQRRFRAVVRLQVGSNVPEHILETLVANLELDPRDVYPVDGPLDLGRLRQLLSIERPDLKDAPFLPYTPPDLNPKSEEDIFTVLRRGDVLLHHPFDSFQPVVEFLRRAADDPDVLAIKITLYRVGRNSPVVESLLSAIENGKQVAVLLELKARFDEESNIEWAKALEAAGVHVVYGLVGLKVHCKVAMVVRK